MPPRRGHAGPRIGGDGQPVRRDRPGAVDDQFAGGVVEAEDVELGPRRGVEHVGQGQRGGLGEHRAAGGLNGDVEGVLGDARRQHVRHQLRRHGADADLGVLHRLAAGVDQAAGLHGQAKLARLLLGQVVAGGTGRGGDHRRLGGADRGEDGVLDSGQIHRRVVGVGLLLLGGAHAAHHGVGGPGLDGAVHGHGREVEARRRVGGGGAVDDHFDIPGRDVS